MCHEWWTRRERRREEEFDRELRYLLDEEAVERKDPTPIVEHDHDEAPVDPQPIETGSR
jgi:hypothetical protein